jgi:hypothetical protein
VNVEDNYHSGTNFHELVIKNMQKKIIKLTS